MSSGFVRRRIVTLSPGPWGHTEPFADLPAVLGSIGGRVEGDCMEGVAAESLLPLQGCQGLDLDASHSQAGGVWMASS